MTFKQLWTTIRTAWQSRPLAILLPIVALAVYWYKHGHTWTAESFPSWGEWVAGSLLLTTKFERLTEFLFGAPAPATLPAAVSSPALVAPPPGDGPRAAVILALFLGLGFGMSGCAHISAIERDIRSCVSTDAPKAIQDAEAASVKFLEEAFVCEADSGFSEAAIPPCLLASLSGVAAQVGPDAQRFETCVVTTVENDPAATERVKQRARLVHIKLALGR